MCAKRQKLTTNQTEHKSSSLCNINNNDHVLVTSVTCLGTKRKTKSNVQTQKLYGMITQLRHLRENGKSPRNYNLSDHDDKNSERDYD